MLLSDLCRGQRRDAGLLVVAFGSPGGDHRIWDLERLIEYGRGDDGVGSKVPNGWVNLIHNAEKIYRKSLMLDQIVYCRKK